MLVKAKFEKLEILYFYLKAGISKFLTDKKKIKIPVGMVQPKYQNMFTFMDCRALYGLQTVSIGL